MESNRDPVALYRARPGGAYWAGNILSAVGSAAPGGIHTAPSPLLTSQGLSWQGSTAATGSHRCVKGHYIGKKTVCQ